MYPLSRHTFFISPWLFPALLVYNRLGPKAADKVQETVRHDYRKDDDLGQGRLAALSP